MVRRLFASVLALGLGAAACADLKTATPETDGGVGSSSSSGSSSSGSSGTSDASSGGSSSSSGTTGGPTGPGPYGALPGGFCCTRDEECRNRHCVDKPAGKMCLDDCRGTNDPCTRSDVQFTCDSPGQFEDGLCQPPGGFVCKPAESFQRGTKKQGACCTPTGDGNAGIECEGGVCIAIGPSTNPFVCSNACAGPGDCGPAYICTSITNTKKECIPANTTYTCN